MKRFAGLMLVLVACGSRPPAEPPATTTTTATIATTTVTTEGRQPEEYFPLERVRSILEDLTAQLQENAWAGWRDALYVAEHCAWALVPAPGAIFPLTRAEMLVFADEGAELDVEGGGYVARLPQANRRCEPSHAEHDPRFCGRSEVRRDRLSEFRSHLEAHLERAWALRDALNGQPGHGSLYDSVKGFCEWSQRQ